MNSARKTVRSHLKLCISNRERFEILKPGKRCHLFYLGVRIFQEIIPAASDLRKR